MTHIEGYYNYKATSGRIDGKGGLSYQSIKRHCVVLNLIFKYAIHQSLIKENPCEYAKIPNNAKRSEKQTNFYTPEQCNELLKVTENTILHDMIYITFVYGLRRSELMGLKWSAVDFDKGTLTIEHTRVANGIVVEKDKTKNKSSRRTYPLIDGIMELLLKLRAEQKEYKKLFGNCYHDTGYVFTKEDGSTYYPDYPTKRLEKVVRRNNLKPIRWHDLRHSTASMLLVKGWRMKDIFDWLGHSDIGTTMNIYGHLTMEHKQSIGNSLNGLFDK